MNTKSLIVSLTLGLVSPLSCLADTVPGTTSSTAQWLDLQRQQSLASAHSQAAPALAREKAMERQFKTYDQPIPDKYFSDSFKSGQ